MWIFIIIAIVSVILCLCIFKTKKNSQNYQPVTQMPENGTDSGSDEIAALLLDAYAEGTPPYIGNEITLSYLEKKELLIKEKDIISRLFHFFKDNCSKPEFIQIVEESLTPMSALDEARNIYFIGDIIQCYIGLGIDISIYTPHGMVLYMALNHIRGTEHLCEPLKLGCAKISDLKQGQIVCENVVDVYKMFTGCDPFIISSILIDIDLQKRNEYLNLLIELSECLMEIQSINLERYEAFIANLKEMQSTEGKDSQDKETIPSNSEPVELWGITEPVTDHEEVSETWTTNVAGASKRCTKEDIGGIVGYVEAEPTNQYNPNAMAVYLQTGKHIGYIYDSELEDYRAWSRCKKLPFVGYIHDEGTHISSRIHIIVPKSREFLLERAGKFYIYTKEHGKLGLIPNVVDMIVPQRDK